VLAIETNGLVKTFGDVHAVDGVDLAVSTGSVYSILGPNGAGKTTIVRILATLLRPDAGEARVFGHDVAAEPDAVRRRVSLTGQFASVDDELTGLENLVLVARLLGYRPAAARQRARELLDAFDLSEISGRLVNTYSGGERRRLDIATSIVVRQDLLFLDEPTTGLDPRSRQQVWEIIQTMVAEGATVLLTTQYLDEADRLADRIALLDHGKVIAEGTPGELKSRVGSNALQVALLDAAQAGQAEQVLSGALDATVDRVPGQATRLTARVSDPERAAAALATLYRADINISSFALGQPTLDEVFLALTGHPATNDSVDEKEEATA
jgi:ABC-2 type transport system ATP-binding protein